MSFWSEKRDSNPRPSTEGVGYTTTSYSSILGTVSISDLLTVTYYDEYTQFTAANGFNQLGFVPKPGLIAYAGGNGYFTGTRGLVTGTKTRVLDTNEWLYGVTYYDDRYRPIQTRGTLYGGTAGDGYTASTRYDFSGKVLRAEEVQVFGGVATTITTGNTYDHVGRLLTTTQQVTHNGTSTGTVTVAQNQYSALGQLREKNLANGHQSVDYTYNIRGWLTSINNPDDLTAAGNSDSYADLFGMRLSYSETTATGALPQYNGNIAGVVWSTNHNALKRSAYGYRYDALCRLTGSDYWTTPSSALANSTAYEERGISYDLNGNTKTLVRTKGDGTVRDSLAYTYSGNRLTQLNSWNGYAYDGNGNMTTDDMRGFSVEYNLLNLPKKVSRGTDNISYIYSATGAKLAMLDTNTVRNYYAGTCVYKGDRTLDYALHPEGVVRVTTSTSGVKSLSYEYFLKDHLGNTRVVFNGNDSVLQATDYYAFGMAHTPKVQENENRYLYNGKEQQDALLGGVQFDWYDYGARFYDPMLGRWHSIDPLVELHNEYTPYAYVYNNPIRLIDPFGCDSIDINDTNSLLALAKKHNFTLTIQGVTLNQKNDEEDPENAENKVQEELYAVADATNIMGFDIAFLEQSLKKTGLKLGKSRGKGFVLYGSTFYGNKYTRIYKLGKPLKIAGHTLTVIQLSADAGAWLMGQNEEQRDQAIERIVKDATMSGIFYVNAGVGIFLTVFDIVSSTTEMTKFREDLQKQKALQNGGFDIPSGQLYFEQGH